MDDWFCVTTAVGVFAMTKRQFYETFPNVVRSSSYQDKGNYHYPNPPKIAMQFRVDESKAPPKKRKIAYVLAGLAVALVVGFGVIYLNKKPEVSPGLEKKQTRQQDRETVVERPVAIAYGSLLVQTEPMAAVVLIDGEGKEMPLGTADAEGLLELEGQVPVGRYRLEARRRDYRTGSLQGVEIQEGDLIVQKIPLIPLPGSLVVLSEPSGADVTINGKLVGKTSYVAGEQEALRDYELIVSLKGYRSAEDSYTLGPNEKKRFNFALEKVLRPVEGENWAIPELGLEMAWINPGNFTMGSPAGEEGRYDDEKQHSVTLTEGYWLGKYEVTQGEWEALMGNNPSHFKNAGKRAPVETVSWEEAMEYCRKVTERERRAGRLPRGYEYSLPTEAQWEYACRAGTRGAIYTGSLRILGENNAPALDPIGWYGGNSGVSYEGGYDSTGWPEKQYNHKRAGTHPVGKKKANDWGLYDMTGNVYEWCSDWYGAYAGSRVRDPAGPSSGSDRVLRGGSGYYYAQYCRSAYRSRSTPSYRFNYLGFRLALRAVP